jgi:hypothetical protein
MLAMAGQAGASMYFGAAISAETYGQTGSAPMNLEAWDRFERNAGAKVAILNQNQAWVTFDKPEFEATHARGAIPLVTMGLGAGVTLADIVAGKQDAAIRKWAQEAKAWGHPFLFAPWWEMNGAWYTWGRSPEFIPAWRHFHDVVAGQGASNVTWTWVVNSIWFDPASDPTPYYPGDAYVDWTGLDSYNWGLNPAQPDKWINPEQTITPTLKLIREAAPTKPLAIVETASSEFGGNKTDWIREMLTTYLPHHPEIGAFLWFNWNFKKGENRADWPIESSAPAQQEFRSAVQSSLFVAGPLSLPALTKVPPPAAKSNDPAQAADLTPAAEMAAGPDVDAGPDGTATVVWSARSGGEFKVFARQIAVDGTRGPIHQLSAAGGDALDPRVAVAPDGTAIVAWSRWDGANFRLQERRIAPNGAPEEATRTLSGSGQNAISPQVDVAPDGEATVVWKRFDGFHYLVLVRHILPDGTTDTASQRLSEAGQDAVEPDVAVAGDGTATVVWSRFDGSDSIIQARRVAPDGTPAANTANLSAAGESAIQPQVELAPDGTATVIWNRFNGSNWLIQGQRFAANGTAAGAIFDLSAPGRSAAEPQLAIDSRGVATAVWDRYDGNNFLVQSRQIGPSGNLLAAPVQLSAGGRSAGDPQVAAAPDGSATVLWSRFDGANWLVQRRNLDPLGVLAATTTTLSAAGRGAGEAALAWGGDGTLAMIWQRAAGSGEVVQTNSIAPPPPPPPPTKPSPAPSAGQNAADRPAATADRPDNSFQIGTVKLNRRLGTAKLTVVVPGPGMVAVDGAVPQQHQADAAGRVVLQVRPKPKGRRLLVRSGSVRLKLTVTFVPRGGEPNSRGLSLRLKKELGAAN